MLTLRRCLKTLVDHTHKLHRARVNGLLFSADRRLLTPRADTLESFLNAKLSDDAFYNTYRPTAFVRLVRFCLERHLFDLALVLYHRMRTEGFLAPRALSLRMTALQSVQRGRHDDLPKLVRNEEYDVPAFMDLVRYLADKRASGIVDGLADAFISARQLNLGDHPDLVGELATTHMHAGRLDAAQRWIDVFEQACGTQGILPDVTPYSDVISNLDPKNIDAIQDVLVRMRSAGVSPDVAVFNALIRANLVQQRYREAFALYHVLMDKRSDTLMPNDVTFKLFLRATLVLDQPRVARRHGRPDNIVQPRTLFRDMLDCHLQRTNGRPSEPSNVVSVSAFHLALRVCMARDDYAAAYIVLRALSTFGFQPNLQTYVIVLVRLVERMKREASLARQPETYRFVDVLTHVRPNDDGDDPNLVAVVHDRMRGATVGCPPVGIDTVAHLLSLGEHVRTEDDLPNPTALARFPSGGRRMRVPAVDMVTGEKAKRTGEEGEGSFAPLPLARIVYKAFLAELCRKAVHRGDWDWRRAADVILGETGREMVPDGVVATETEGTARRDVLPFPAARMRRRRRGARGGRAITFDFEG